MSKGNVDKFLELMQTDEGLARRMAACLYMLENGGGASDGSGGFIAREIVPLAKEYGFEFTAQDFLDYTNEATAKAGLSAEDLAEVSGGKGGVRAALMGTLALLGVAAAPAAMEMVSGGEVAPFSMVASAADEDKVNVEVEILKNRSNVVLENVKQALKNDTIEEMTLEIKNVQEFLQFLDTKNIDDQELKQKRSDLSDLIYDLADAVLESVKQLLKNGTVEEITVERKNAQEFLQFLEMKNIDDQELKQKRTDLRYLIDDLSVKEIDLYKDIIELKNLKVDFDDEIDRTEKSIKELTEDNLRTTLENTLEEALNTAKTKRNTFTEALENINAGNSSDVLQNARKQYNDFVSEILSYLKMLKGESTKALQTDAVESRRLLVTSIERLKINDKALLNFDTNGMSPRKINS